MLFCCCCSKAAMVTSPVCKNLEASRSGREAGTEQKLCTQIHPLPRTATDSLRKLKPSSSTHKGTQYTGKEGDFTVNPGNNRSHHFKRKPSLANLRQHTEGLDMLDLTQALGRRQEGKKGPRVGRAPSGSKTALQQPAILPESQEAYSLPTPPAVLTSRASGV